MYRRVNEHMEIDREQRVVRQNGREIHLTGLEFKLLDYLVSHANHVCTRSELLDCVWGESFRYDTGTIDVHLNALRRKLGWSSKNPVETIRGVGLVFRIEHSLARYTIDLQSFIADWLRSHEVEISAAGLVAQMHLCPFVNELTITPDALKRMLDSILSALLPAAEFQTHHAVFYPLSGYQRHCHRTAYPRFCAGLADSQTHQTGAYTNHTEDFTDRVFLF